MQMWATMLNACRVASSTVSVMTVHDIIPRDSVSIYAWIPMLSVWLLPDSVRELCILQSTFTILECRFSLGLCCHMFPSVLRLEAWQKCITLPDKEYRDTLRAVFYKKDRLIGVDVCCYWNKVALEEILVCFSSRINP